MVGAGDLAKEVAGWMLSSDSALLGERDFCFIDDNVSQLTAGPYSLKYLGTVDNFFPSAGDELIAAVASPKIRSVIVDKLVLRGSTFIPYIHPSAAVSVGET